MLNATPSEQRDQSPADLRCMGLISHQVDVGVLITLWEDSENF
jgi:hypothetical protein